MKINPMKYNKLFMYENGNKYRLELLRQKVKGFQVAKMVLEEEKKLK